MNRFISHALLGFALSLPLYFIITCGDAADQLIAAEPTTAALEFARVEGHPLLLDLYQPKSDSEHDALIVWVHGGAWRRGSRASVPINAMTERGFTIASVDYRLSEQAPFPAQVHDIKGAIRFLRANASKYRIDPDRIFIAGASAGGHLAALVGVSDGVKALEGSVGNHSDVSSRVGAIVSFYGASNLQTILSQSTPHGLSVRVPALQLLLRAQPDEAPDLARLASPVAHVDASDPPLLLIHGDQDPQMPINQSHELQGAYRKVGAPVQFVVVHGAAHGGAAFYTPEMLDRVAAFLNASVSSKSD